MIELNLGISSVYIQKVQNIYFGNGRTVQKSRVVKFVISPNDCDGDDECIPISTHKSAEKEKPKEETKRYPTRDRKPPQHLGEYDEEHQEYHSTSTCFVHHVYKCVSGIPNTYEEAINSPDAMEWINAMEDEINLL